MIAQFLVLAALPALLLAAAGWDIASYTIPNFLQAALLAAFLLFAASSGMTLTSFGLHLAAGAFGLVLGFVLFAFGYIGGGDAKLFACAAIWFGLGNLADYALFASIFGGLLTFGLLGFRKYPLPAILSRQSWLLHLHDDKAGIPYGAALAAGAFAVLPYTDVFRMGVAG